MSVSHLLENKYNPDIQSIATTILARAIKRRSTPCTSSLSAQHRHVWEAHLSSALPPQHLIMCDLRQQENQPCVHKTRSIRPQSSVRTQHGLSLKTE
jgi:hypothetical protein